MERFCRECGAPITGRPDKQFCNDDCRTAWHNHLYHKQRRPTVVINGILSRNRKILEEIFRAGVRSVRLSDRRLRGYDFRYFTSVERSVLHPARYGVYEYSFSILAGRIYHIKKQPAGR